MEVTLEIVCGNINSPNQGSGKAYVFHSPANDSVRKGCKETFLSTAIKECTSLGTKISFSRGAARRNVQTDMGGSISVSQLSLREGEVLKVFAQKKQAGWNGVMKTAAVFLQARAGAALTRLHIRVPEGISDNNQIWHVTGRFEILRDIELAKAMGINVLKACEGQHRASMFDSLFRIEELAPALTSAPVVGVKKVGDKTMTVKRSRRAFEI